MSKERILIYFILIGFSSCKKDCRIVQENYSSGKERIVYTYPDCNDTAIYKKQVFYENGHLWSEGFYKNKLKHGHFKCWYINGQLEADWNVVRGVEKGFTQCWYENGQKKKECNVIWGLESGLQKTWHNDGKQESEGYLVLGNKEGLWKFWLHDGTYEERHYSNDTLNGTTFETLIDKRTVFGQYKNGEEDGQWIWKDSIGNVDQIAFYKNGVYDGTAIGYYPDGKKREEAIYQNGVRISTKKY